MATRRIAERAAEASPDTFLCRVAGCKRPTQRSAGKGLSEGYCKVHIAFQARHGSYWRKSITGPELRPYRDAAHQWLKERGGDGLVAQVVASLDALLASAGPVESAYDLRAFSPRDKARIAFARLRDAGIPGGRLLETAMGVISLVQAQDIADQEYLEVQIAKAIHRLASGTNKTLSGNPIRAKYAHSSGKVLRILGHQIWDRAATVARGAAIVTVTKSAQPNIAKVQKMGAKRKDDQAVRRKTEEAIERQIVKARDYGMGPQSLDEMRRTLRRRYGLS